MRPTVGSPSDTTYPSGCGTTLSITTMLCERRRDGWVGHITERFLPDDPHSLHPHDSYKALLEVKMGRPNDQHADIVQFWVTVPPYQDMDWTAQLFRLMHPRTIAVNVASLAARIGSAVVCTAVERITGAASDNCGSDTSVPNAYTAIPFAKRVSLRNDPVSEDGIFIQKERITTEVELTVPLEIERLGFPPSKQPHLHMCFEGPRNERLQLAGGDSLLSAPE